MKSFILKLQLDSDFEYDNPMYVLLENEECNIGKVEFSTFNDQLEGKFILDTRVNKDMYVYPLLNENGEKFYYAILLTSKPKVGEQSSTIKELIY